MEDKKEPVQPAAEDIDDLDAAFDAALAGLSDANAKVTEVLETMDNPNAISSGVEVDEDGNIYEGETADREPSKHDATASESADE